jgi:N-acetylglutamate synthase-like GNAT family acetyltransferase
MSDTITIRSAQPADVPRLTLLSAQLGYAVTEESVAHHLSMILSKEDNALLVAEIKAEVIGWIHVYIRPLLTDALNIEIGGLIVDEDCRSRGAGAELVRSVEEWAVARGVEEAFVRSRITRGRAHQFYERCGYTNIKTSYTFHKVLR